MATSVELRSVYKRCGEIEVVHGINLDIEPGEFSVFVAPPAAGNRRCCG
jgi:multiple sugar transport system ATP-binding protein